MGQVGCRHSHEHGAEERGDRGLARQAEPPCAGGDEQRRRQLDRRVERADSRPTGATAALQNRIGDERQVVIPGELGTAAHAR